MNSAFWTNHLYRCNRVRYQACRIVAPTEGKTRAPSSDAIDLDVCRDVVVRGVTLRNIALKCRGKFYDVRQSDQYQTEDLNYDNCKSL